MSLWSDLNGNLGKAPEHVESMDMDKNRMKGPGDDLLVDSIDLGKTPKRPVFLSLIAVAVIVCLAVSVAGKLNANDKLDTFVVTVINEGSSIRLYEHQKKVNAYENGEWIYKEAPFVVGKLDEMTNLFPIVEWTKDSELRVPDRTMLKWFDLYDNSYTCIRRFSNEDEVRVFLNAAERGTYYVVAGASWEGRYVLKSFTNESFTSEFVLTVVKK